MRRHRSASEQGKIADICALTDTRCLSRQHKLHVALRSRDEVCRSWARAFHFGWPSWGLDPAAQRAHSSSTRRGPRGLVSTTFTQRPQRSHSIRPRRTPVLLPPFLAVYMIFPTHYIWNKVHGLLCVMLEESGDSHYQGCQLFCLFICKSVW